MVMFFTQALLLLIFLFATILFLKKINNGSNKNTAPGPIKIPFIGNLIQLYLADSSLAHIALFKLSKKYGEIMSVKYGSINGVVLSSHEAMSKVFAMDDCIDKFNYCFCDSRIPGETNLGLIFGSGEKLAVIRRFTVKNLRSYGYGKIESFESVISEAVDNFVKKLQKDSEMDEVVQFENYFGSSIVSIIWSYMFGYKISPDDPKIKRHVELAEEFGKIARVDSFANLFPTISKFFPKLTGLELVKSVFKEQFEFMEDCINKSKKALQDDMENQRESPQNFIYAFLLEIEKQKENPKKYFTLENMIVTVEDLFTAASETTSNYLSYAILLMVHYPRVQKKIQAEIDIFYKYGNKVSLNDMKKLPYIEAVLLEIHRFVCLAPSVVPRNATRDIVYKNYVIPKGTLIMSNLYPVLHDENYWGDPSIFRPERFINNTNNSVLNDLFIGQPFGYGKRACPGETLAKCSIFLYFVNLLKNFEFEPIDYENLPTLNPVSSFSLGPHPFNCIVKSRN